MAHVLFIISGEEGRKTLMLWTEQAMKSCDALCVYSQQQGHNQSCKTKTLLDEHYCFSLQPTTWEEKLLVLFFLSAKKNSLWVVVVVLELLSTQKGHISLSDFKINSVSDYRNPRWARIVNVCSEMRFTASPHLCLNTRWRLAQVMTLRITRWPLKKRVRIRLTWHTANQTYSH